MGWYYIDQAGGQCGPVSTEELRTVMAGSADYYVFREGFTDWVLASQVEELGPRSSSTPPPLPQAAWRSDPVTEAQKNRLMLYGVEVRPGMSKGEASDIIDRMQSSGVKPDKKNLAEYKERRDEAHLEDAADKTAHLIRRLKEPGLGCDELELISNKIESLAEEVLHICDKRIGKLVKEGEKAAPLEEINRNLSLFDDDRDWKEFYRKPTRKQVEQVLDEFDKSGKFPSEVEFVQRLAQQFPELRK
jgi:hypothetical protein